MRLTSFNPRAWRYYAERLGFRFYIRQLLFFDISIKQKPAYDTDDTVHYRQLSAEFSKTNGVIGWLSQRETCNLHHQAGFILCGAFLGPKLVGNCWLELETCDLEFLDLYDRLPDYVAYVSRVFVNPEARGKGISEGLIDFALKEAERAGKKVAKICCVPSNQAMKHILSKNGFTYLGDVQYMRAMMFRLYRLRSADGKRIHLTAIAHRASAGIFGDWC